MSHDSHGLSYPRLWRGDLRPHPSARYADMTHWRSSLVAYQFHPPANLTVAEVGAWLTNIQAMTHPSGVFALLPVSPVCFEVVSSARGVSFYVLVAREAAQKLLSGLRASMPGCRITESSWLFAYPTNMAGCRRTDDDKP